MANDERVLFDVKEVVREDLWFDLWHTHVDWDGDGNSSSTSRHHYLVQLFTLFDQLRCHIESWTKPRQIWIVIDAVDSSQDAVYLHTKNPNKHNFPYQFEGVTWGCPIPLWLVEFVPNDELEFGDCRYNGFLTYWVREKGPNKALNRSGGTAGFEMETRSPPPG